MQTLFREREGRNYQLQWAIASGFNVRIETWETQIAYQMRSNEKEDNLTLQEATKYIGNRTIAEMEQKVPANPEVTIRHGRTSDVLAQEKNIARPIHSAVALDDARDNINAHVTDTRRIYHFFHPLKIATRRIDYRCNAKFFKNAWEGTPNVDGLDGRRAWPRSAFGIKPIIILIDQAEIQS